MSNASLIERDLAVLWHPCTQMKDHEQLPPIPIRRGQGVWLEDFDGNMRMYDASYLRLLREACDSFKVHLIADEVAVGFGRTGTMFACEQAQISPDFMCLSKGLTGGYLPLSVTLTSDDIYAAFYADYATQKAFLHSHSYTGNPLACRAALATLDIFAADNVVARNRDLTQIFH